MADSTSLNLQDVLRNVQNYIGGLEGTKSVVKENFQKAEKLEARKQEIYDQISNDAALVTMTQKSAELSAQTATIKAANAAGINPQLDADRLVHTMSDLAKDQDAVRTNLINIKVKSEQKFFDDPIKWIQYNIFGGINDDVNKLQNNKALLDQSAAALTQLNQSLSAAGSVNKQVAESVTQASAEAAARLVAGEARVKSIDAEIQGVKYNTAMIQSIAELSKEQLGVLFQANSASNAEKHLGLAFAGFELEKQRFQWQKEEAELRRAAANEGKEFDSIAADYINRSRVARGLDPLEGTTLKSALIVLKNDKIGKSEFAYDFQNGGYLASTGQKFGIGTSPAESLEVLSRYRSNLAPTMKATAGLLEEAKAALAANKGIDKKDPAATAAFVNNHVNSRIRQMYANVTPDESNPFYVGDLSQYMNSMSATKNLPVVTKVLDPVAKLGQPLDNPKTVAALVVKAVKDKTISTSEAADLSVVFQTAALTKQAAAGLQGFGIVAPNAGRNYFIKMGSWPATQTVDFANQQAWTRYLMQQLAAERAATGAPSFGPGKTPTPR